MKKLVGYVITDSNEYKGLPLLRSWECNVYREL